MIGKIEKGMTIDCLECGESIELDDNSMTFDINGEYIKCPHCGSEKDIQAYHMNGKINGEDKVETIALKRINKVRDEETTNSVFMETINDMIDKSGIQQVEINGMYRDLFEIGGHIEEVLRIIFGIGHALTDAPFMGWKGERLKELWRVQKELEQKAKELYAIILAGTGRKVGENDKPYYVDRYAWHLDEKSGMMCKISKIEEDEE